LAVEFEAEEGSVDGKGEAELTRLMNAADGGDERAYREFLLRAHQLVGAFVRQRAFPGGVDPEEVVQETLLAIHNKRHTRRQDMPITPWLYAIARYKLVDSLRRRGRRREIAIDGVAETLAAPQAEAARSWEVDRALQQLAPGQRAVVTAISVQGRSITETAHDLGMKEPAVRVALHRGLAAIAARFGRRA
jgi:RNA polymerase sigma-70 factor, ECF subfamily